MKQVPFVSLNLHAVLLSLLKTRPYSGYRVIHKNIIFYYQKVLCWEIFPGLVLKGGMLAVAVTLSHAKKTEFCLN